MDLALTKPVKCDSMRSFFHATLFVLLSEIKFGFIFASGFVSSFASGFVCKIPQATKDRISQTRIARKQPKTLPCVSISNHYHHNFTWIQIANLHVHAKHSIHAVGLNYSSIILAMRSRSISDLSPMDNHSGSLSAMLSQINTVISCLSVSKSKYLAHLLNWRHVPSLHTAPQVHVKRLKLANRCTDLFLNWSVVSKAITHLLIGSFRQNHRQKNYCDV